MLGGWHSPSSSGACVQIQEGKGCCTVWAGMYAWLWGKWAYQSPSLGILAGGRRWCSLDVYICSIITHPVNYANRDCAGHQAVEYASIWMGAAGTSAHRMSIVSVVACRAAELTAKMILKGRPRQRECCQSAVLGGPKQHVQTCHQICANAKPGFAAG